MGGDQGVLDTAARADNAGARQEAAACGRMAMRARLAGGDPRHFDLDARYYQRWPERTRVPYPHEAHRELDRTAQAYPPLLARWPTGEQIDRAAYTRKPGWLR